MLEEISESNEARDFDLSRNVEYGEVRHALDRSLRLNHARWLRGAIIGLTSRVEFHNHRGADLIYQHPLIRYDTSTGHAAVIGLAEGAVLVRGIPEIDSLILGQEKFAVTERKIILDRVKIGPKPNMILYEFQTPYLALNQENHEAWGRATDKERSRLLERVLVGNLLSLSKAIGLNVSVHLRVEADLFPSGFEELKPGLRFLGFRGSFRVNFLLPPNWGIGKSSSRGFGTIKRKEP